MDAQVVFMNEIRKIAGVRSELGGGLTSSLSGLGALIGAAKGPYEKKELAEADKKDVSNFLPGVGGYRLARRLMAATKGRTQESAD
jgi:hypothetical protein